MRPGAAVSTMGRSSANERRSAFTAYCRAGNVTLRPDPPRRSQIPKPMSLRPQHPDPQPSEGGIRQAPIRSGLFILLGDACSAGSRGTRRPQLPTDDVAFRVDRCGPGKSSTRYVNRAELPGAQHVTMACSADIAIGADNFTTWVISERVGERWPRDINWRNYAAVQHIAVSQAIEVGSHGIVARVYPAHVRKNRTRNVDDAEGTLAQHETVSPEATTRRRPNQAVISDDIAAIIDPESFGARRTWEINARETTSAQQKPVRHTGTHIGPGDVAARIDCICRRCARSGKSIVGELCLLKTSYVLMPLNLPTETGRLWSP
jgi:hypothetical protein